MTAQIAFLLRKALCLTSSLRRVSEKVFFVTNHSNRKVEDRKYRSLILVLISKDATTWLTCIMCVIRIYRREVIVCVYQCQMNCLLSNSRNGGRHQTDKIMSIENTLIYKKDLNNSFCIITPWNKATSCHWWPFNEECEYGAQTS